MTKLTCVVCGKPLTGGTDTFGEIAQPMCQTDYLGMAVEDEMERQWLREREQHRRDLLHELLMDQERVRSKLDEMGEFIAYLEPGT